MDPNSDGQDAAAASALKPFNPNGMGPIEVVKRRSAAHADLSEEAGEISKKNFSEFLENLNIKNLVTQLLNADAEFEKLKYRKFESKSERTNSCIYLFYFLGFRNLHTNGGTFEQQAGRVDQDGGSGGVPGTQ